MKSKFLQTNSNPYALLVNANAGKVKSGAFKINRFRSLFDQQIDIRETLTLDEMAQTLQDLAEKQTQVLFIFGGDGTQQKVLSEILKHNLNFPYIVPLKGGTMNMFVKDVGLGGPAHDVAVSVKNLMETRYPDIPILQKPILKLSFDSKILYGFYFANGVIYKILRRYYENPSSVYNAFRVTVEGLVGSLMTKHRFARYFDPVTYTIEYDGEKLEENQFLGIMISSLNRVVFGMRPFIQKPKTNDELSFMGYSFPKRDMIKYFFFLAKGIRPKNARVTSLTAKKFTINSETGFILDGEVYDLDKPSSLTLEVGGQISIPVIG